ncbi:DUF1542 domain-containing protein [Streptococcus pseudopneumoniae]|uniref:DUF1542 domain-containing protein n=1 Tax=Streptococcus pseudopneumoniae TaxID=257758 RepID=UPI0018B04839|nr:DUF1542 domain-containing protein [Streptococcus pseudopneumoniae]MBF9686926.1 DUF1542 domain-containing protein [Streptococcus pseudopneumoniae]
MDKKVSMSRSERLRREKVTRYSIRKYSFGAASVAVAALFMFLGNGAVSAAENGADSQGGAAVAASPNGGGEADPGDGAPSTGAENESAPAGGEDSRVESTAPTYAGTTKTENGISYTVEFSDDAKKEVYVYNKEEANVGFHITSNEDDKVTYVETTRGSNQKFTSTSDATIVTDGYGYNFKKITTETPLPLTVAMTGQPNDALMRNSGYTKNQEQHLSIGERYLRVTSKKNKVLSAAGSGVNAIGYFKVVLKSQTYKYSIHEPATNADKISVTDIDNLSVADIEKIKNQLKVEHSKTSQDARLESKKGTVVERRDSVVDRVTVENRNVTVIYKDGSTDTVPVANVARTNQRPTVEIDYSDPAPTKKEVFVYGAEENSFDIKIKDDGGKIKSAVLKKGSNQSFKDAADSTDKTDVEYGFKADKITSETVATEGEEAIIRYTGTPAPGPGLPQNKLDEVLKKDGVALGVRFVNAIDQDNVDARVNRGTISDPAAFRVVLKPQTQKYDIKTPEEADKVVVTDPAAVTEEEFEKVKEKVKLEYSQNNPDRRLESKRGQEVGNQNSKIQTIAKDGNDLLVTYRDGSIDRRPLTEFTTLNKQPAIDAVNKAAEDKIAEINAIADPNTTDDEKQAAIAKVNADKEKALAAINDPNLTTKAALDQAQTEGTTAIAADNPVVAKKAEAKAAIEAARKAKEDAINADINLSEAEKTVAIAKANEAARAATEKIDAATTDAAVNEAQTEATTAISKVNPIAKENAKAAIANALTAKNDEIDKRTDLSQAEKDAAKAEAQKLADAELAKINAQPDNEDTEDAARATQKLVDAAEDKGVADVTSVNPVAKDAAKKAVADELAKK